MGYEQIINVESTAGMVGGETISFCGESEMIEWARVLRVISPTQLLIEMVGDGRTTDDVGTSA